MFEEKGAMEKGAMEKYFVADIAMNGIKVYVYRDSAEIVSPMGDIRFERTDSEMPEDLALKLIKDLSNAF